MRQVGSVRVYWASVERDCERHKNPIQSWEEMKDKFKGKYLIESYRQRLLDKLHNFRQGSMSIQDYMTAFDVITLHYEVQEDCLHVIFRFCLGLRSDIQCTMLIHSRNVTSLAQASQLAQDIDNSHKFSLECRFVLKLESSLDVSLSILSELVLIPLRTLRISR